VSINVRQSEARENDVEHALGRINAFMQMFLISLHENPEELATTVAKSDSWRAHCSVCRNDLNNCSFASSSGGGTKRHC
jgi:hypothetical protein